MVQQQWTKANTGFQVSITVQECIDYFQQILYRQKQFDQLFADRTLQLSYDMLVKAPNQNLQEILAFMGVKEIALSTETSKNIKTKLSDCIINYTELKSHFTDTDYATYFIE